MMCKHICSQMNVAIAAMIAGCLRHRRRDHAVTRIHDNMVHGTKGERENSDGKVTRPQIDDSERSKLRPRPLRMI